MLMGEFIDHLEQEKFYGQFSRLFHAITRKDRDLEFLLEELEDWTRKTYLDPPLQVPSLGAEVPDAVGETVNDAKQLLANLRRDVFEQYRRIENLTAVTPLFAPIFDAIFTYLHSGKHCLPIFTTNYDPAIEEFRRQNTEDYRLDDGFNATAYSPNHSWSRKCFESLRLAAC